MTNLELLQKIRSQLMQCAGYDADDIAAARADALDYYFMRDRGDEISGRSNVVSGDVSAMVEAILAQMMAALTSNNLAEFDAIDEQDERQAELETDAVVHFMMAEGNGYLELSQAIKDALLLRNGLLKIWCEETKRVQTREFVNVRPEAVPGIQQRFGPNVECEVKRYDPDKGELTLRCTFKTKRFRSRALPPENFLYRIDLDSLDLQEAGFCAERHVEPRSDLIERGFSRADVEKLPAMRWDVKTDELARRPHEISSEPNIAIDDSQQMVEWFEVHCLMDSDGDGISERRRISVSTDCSVLLENEPARLVPIAAGAVIVNPHEFTGVSIFDKLKQTQDINTALNRALLDNANACNKNRLAYLDGKVNTDDLNDPRNNGELRVRASVGDVSRAVMAFGVPDLSGGLLQNLEYQRTVRAELGGASLELATGQMQLASDRVGSQGLDRAYSVMEQLAALLMQNLAATLIRSAFLLAHATLREHWDTPVPIKRNGEWFSPIPAEWPERRRVTVKVGLSPGERARKKEALAFTLNSQLQLAEKGLDGVLVDATRFYRTLMDWSRVSEISNPEQYWINPDSKPAQEAAAARAQAAQTSEALQRQLMSQAVGLEQLRIALDKYRADQKTQFDYFNALLGADVKEAEIVADVAADLIKGTDDAKRSGPEKLANAA